MSAEDIGEVLRRVEGALQIADMALMDICMFHPASDTGVDSFEQIARHARATALESAAPVHNAAALLRVLAQQPKLEG
jgi:hypothetical protein